MKVTRIVVEFSDESAVELDGRYVPDEMVRVAFSHPYRPWEVGDGWSHRYVVDAGFEGDRAASMLEGIKALVDRRWVP